MYNSFIIFGLITLVICVILKIIGTDKVKSFFRSKEKFKEELDEETHLSIDYRIGENLSCAEKGTSQDKEEKLQMVLSKETMGVFLTRQNGIRTSD